MNIKKLHPIALLNPDKAMGAAKELPGSGDFQTLLVLAACCQNTYNVSTVSIMNLAYLLSNAKKYRYKMAVIKTRLNILRKYGQIDDTLVKGRLEGMKVNIILGAEEKPDCVIQLKVGQDTRELFAQLGSSCVAIIPLAIHANGENLIDTKGKSLKKLIADELGISERTAQRYISRLQKRYNVTSSKGKEFNIKPLARLKNRPLWHLSPYISSTVRVTPK